ncbi:MAG: S-layer homology domain-containing protein, partial [Firmicutes bacterium]|nr:S-layer homology domain-containing protein [Bacillota bacterium]
NKDTLDAIYTLYDATGEEVMSYHDKEYIDLPQGAYTLKVRSRSQNWNPERTEYEIWLNAGEALVQDVRWQDLSKNKKNYTGINVSFYGLTHELKAKSIDAIELSFTREGTTDVTKHTVPIGEGEGKSEIYLPIGAYTVKILNLPQEYKAVLRYIDNGDVREMYPDGRSLKAIFTTSYSDLEFDIVKEKVQIKGQSTLTIEEVGNKGFLVNYTLKGENYIETQSINRFINLVPGKYTLTVDSIPRGYRLASGAGEITIADGENNVRVVFEVELDKTELKALVSEADKVKASDDYNKSLDQAKEAYDSAVEEAKAVLDKADATQKDIDKAAIKIKAAKQNLAPVDEIVPQTGEEKPEVPSDYVEVKFVAGAHGKLEGTTIFWVNPRVEVELKAPTAIPDDGYTFSKWDKELKAKFIEATTITALYEKTVEIIVPEAPIDNGYHYEPSPDYLKDIRRTERPQPKEEAKKDEPKEEQPATPVVPQPKTYGLEIAEAATPLVFDDINSHILKGDIDFVTARGIMKGTDNGKFEPDTPISRAMVVETLMRISEDKSITSPAIFNDVKETDWYYNSVSWAASNNIVLGDDNNNFRPNELVSKQELALILQRFLKLRGITLDKITEYAYSDEIPEWSKDAVKAMVEVGLITGETTTTLNPTGEVTRAELARALRIIIEWVEANR